MLINVFLVLAMFFIGGCVSFTPNSAGGLNVERLTPEHIAEVKALVEKLEPFITERDKKGELPSLTFSELESPLNSREKQFLRSFRELKAGEVGVRIPFQGFSQGEKDLVRLSGQKLLVKAKVKELPPQFLSPQVYQFYQFMMRAMERDIEKRLFVESGYRSSAHQLYLFIFYLSNHDYSIRETAKWVALPGYSEHGNPEYLAVDFINASGINGEENIAEFEALPEYSWLLKNAARFGFVLSYPKNVGVGITYEPWHWRYNGAPRAPALLNSVDGMTESSQPLAQLPFRGGAPFVLSALRTHQQAYPRSQVRPLSKDGNLHEAAFEADGGLVSLTSDPIPSAGA